MSTRPTFIFAKLDTIGAAAAEEDARFLKECFVDTGDLGVLRDCADARCIVLGRTGSGKTALLESLEAREERVIRVEPESLALSYISNSTILNFVAQLGVNLDIFFRLLWRHVFTVELIQRHFKIEDATQQRGFFDKLKNLFADKKHAQALEYMRQWGSKFWEETDYRIKELTTKLEEDLGASISAKMGIGAISLGAAQKLTEEQKREVIDRAQHVVNTVQIRQLSDIMDMLDEALSDPQRRYYIIVDRLDEDWVEDKVRYRLIRALVETVRDFRKVRNAKLIIAMRVDLFDRLIRITRGSGFQEEKYESLFLKLEWTPEELTRCLDNRVRYLVRQRYMKRPVGCRDVLPRSIAGMDPITWMLERTMMRPRDLILFFNQCIAEATNNPQITGDMLQHAEGEYSRARMRSLADEWEADYPHLMLFTEILKRRTSVFRVGDITTRECEDLCLDVASQVLPRNDDLTNASRHVVEGLQEADDFRRLLIQIFYKVGLVGLKLATYDSVCWAIGGRRSVSHAEITDDVRVRVHPFAWRTLGIRADK